MFILAFKKFTENVPWATEQEKLKEIVLNKGLKLGDRDEVQSGRWIWSRHQKASWKFGGDHIGVPQH